ncbi:MAG: helix-turn-helix domain-containing protein [Jatrophihabitantaceae bacterium]
MLGSVSRVDLPPPGGIAWLEVSAETTDAWPARIRMGPLGLQIAPLTRARAGYYFKGARLRGTRCMWAASTLCGAELTRGARAPHPQGETSVHVLIRAENSGSVFDSSTAFNRGVLRVIDPSHAIDEVFHTNSHLCTFNVHQPTLGMEPASIAAMYGQTYPLTRFQSHLLRSAANLLLADTEGVGSASTLVGIDRYLGSLAGLVLRSSVSRMVDGEQVASVRARTETIIYEQATDPQLTPAAIAAQLSVSLRQLYRAFNGSESPAALIRRRRLERAAELLASRRAITNVESVAQECGFASAEYFSRAFRREFGLSPRAYRSAHREIPTGT